MTLSKLQSHAERLSGESLSTLSAGRTDAKSFAAGWMVSTARQFLDDETEAGLAELAEEKQIEQAISDLFSLVKVNPSEGRPATHWALRAPANTSDEVEAVRSTLDPALEFAEAVRSGGRFTHVLHLGIGGSDFGPRLIYDALKDTNPTALKIEFAANVDPLDLDRALSVLDAKTTLVIGVSKSFSSEETMYNLNRARDWVKASVGSDWPEHFALVTASPDKAQKWLGRESDQLFDMPLSVGGRFSLWSTASLACMIAFGRETFQSFLDGAHEMDEHVRTSDLKDNLALKLALVDYWNMTVRGIHSNIVLAYANALRMLPTYLQQLELESNGKSVGPDGKPAPTRTISGLWGGEGTIGQHSYHQWLHQGSADIAAEFIIALHAGAEPDGNRALVSHALAQAEVLSNGLSESEITAEEPGLDPVIVNQKVMPGGKPSILLVCKDFSAQRLGSLIALYEHRTFLAGRLWGINSFDQWGVERGKVQAGKINKALLEGASVADPVTTNFIEYLSE